MTDRIVVGVDGSEPSAAALRWAVNEARLRGGEVDAVFVWLSSYDYYGAIYNVPANDELEAAARAMLDKILAHQGVGEVEMGEVVVNPIIVEGFAAPRLIEASKGADLLVGRPVGRRCPWPRPVRRHAARIGQPALRRPRALPRRRRARFGR